MLKAMIEKIEKMAGPKVYDIGVSISLLPTWCALTRRRTSPSPST